MIRLRPLRRALIVETAFHRGVDWRALFRGPGFRYIFLAMFISLFGTGMNYAGVTLYILERTGSPVGVSLMLILVTLPGLVVPPFGGVLIDRLDRRRLGVVLDLARAAVVLGTGALLYWGRASLWQVYTMMTALGIGFAIYWSTLNALVQEVIVRDEAENPHPAGSQLAAANATVLIAVQAGMMTAGACVGFLYNRLGIAGILTIDGATYLASALCLLGMRWTPGALPRREVPPTIEAPRGPVPGSTEPAVLPPIVEPGIVMAFVADLREGLRYLGTQPRLFAVGLTYACMMAGVISSHVLLVVLSVRILNAGAVGYGFMESGWAVGAIAGGLLVAATVRRWRPQVVLLAALVTLTVGHMLFPYVRWLWVAVAMNALFGCCRALGGVLTQTAIMTSVPPRLMGRTQSAFSTISTLLQVLMSITLGVVAEHVNLPVAFVLLGSIYGAAALAAHRARALVH